MNYKKGDILLGHSNGSQQGELCIVSKIDFDSYDGQERIWTVILAQLGSSDEFNTAWADHFFYESNYDKLA